MIAVLLLAAAVPGIFWSDSGSAGKLLAAGITRVYAPDAAVDAFRKAGVEAQPESSLKEYTQIPAPQTKMRMDVGAATSVPWIDSNGWRFQRGLQHRVKRAFYRSLPPGTAALAAAEAHAYGADAVLAPDPADLNSLGSMIRFLQGAQDKRLPTMSNIAVVDDGSALLGEVLNLLGRRNLLYTVARDGGPKSDLLVKVGTSDFPKAAAANPNDFAARVREKLSDEKRLLRIYGTYTVIGHLTGDAGKARLYLLNYARRPVKDVHVRVLGQYRRVTLKDSADSKLQAADFSSHRGGTEFTIPSLQTYSILDLEK